uniref:Secreted protein n=1 Tax=Steinernema glaseri TaxID=37863 RepID=A0A1I7Y1X1_9BILA
MLMMMNAVIKNFAGGDDDSSTPHKNKTDVEEAQDLLLLVGENVTFALDANETDSVGTNETESGEARNGTVGFVRLF